MRESRFQVWRRNPRYRGMISHREAWRGTHRCSLVCRETVSRLLISMDRIHSMLWQGIRRCSLPRRKIKACRQPHRTRAVSRRLCRREQLIRSLRRRHNPILWWTSFISRLRKKAQRSGRIRQEHLRCRIVLGIRTSRQVRCRRCKGIPSLLVSTLPPLLWMNHFR